MELTILPVMHIMVRSYWVVPSTIANISQIAKASLISMVFIFYPKFLQL
jgi:hypothetical protein